MDDADLALVLFDASDLRDPLHGVGFWLKQLQSGTESLPHHPRGGSGGSRERPLTAEELRRSVESMASWVRSDERSHGPGLAELVEQ